MESISYNLRGFWFDKRLDSYKHRLNLVIFNKIKLALAS